MTEDEARENVKGLLVDLAEARKTAEEARRRESGIRHLIDGTVTLFPSLASLVPDGVLPPPVPARRRRRQQP